MYHYFQWKIESNYISLSNPCICLSIFHFYIHLNIIINTLILLYINIHKSSTIMAHSCSQIFFYRVIILVDFHQIMDVKFPFCSHYLWQKKNDFYNIYTFFGYALLYQRIIWILGTSCDQAQSPTTIKEFVPANNGSLIIFLEIKSIISYPWLED